MVSPGAHEVSASPDDKLKVAPSTPESPYLVDESRFWVGPGRLDAVIAWLSTHPPKGMADTGGTSSMSGPRPSDRELSKTFISSRPDPRNATIQIAVVDHGGTEVAIRADAQVIWTPPKPAEEMIPDAATEARVLIKDGIPSHVVADEVVTVSWARKLATLFNGLSIDTRGAHGCLADGGYTWTITFTEGPRVLVVNSVPACNSVWLTVGGHSLAGLFEGGALEGPVRASVGLPPR